LGNQIHLERAADTAVLESNKRIVLLRNHSTLLYKRGINIHFTYIIDYNSKTNTFVVCQYAVEKGCLAASEITGKQQDGYFS
jgi:hypothetical protein